MSNWRHYSTIRAELLLCAESICNAVRCYNPPDLPQVEDLRTISQCREYTLDTHGQVLDDAFTPPIYWVVRAIEASCEERPLSSVEWCYHFKRVIRDNGGRMFENIATDHYAAAQNTLRFGGAKVPRGAWYLVKDIIGQAIYEVKSEGVTEIPSEIARRTPEMIGPVVHNDGHIKREPDALPSVKRIADGPWLGRRARMRVLDPASRRSKRR